MAEMGSENVYFHNDCIISISRIGIDRVWCQNKEFFYPFGLFSYEMTEMGPENVSFQDDIIFRIARIGIDWVWYQNEEFFYPFG